MASSQKSPSPGSSASPQEMSSGQSGVSGVMCMRAGRCASPSRRWKSNSLLRCAFAYFKTCPELSTRSFAHNLFRASTAFYCLSSCAGCGTSQYLHCALPPNPSPFSVRAKLERGIWKRLQQVSVVLGSLWIYQVGGLTRRIPSTRPQLIRLLRSKHGPLSGHPHSASPRHVHSQSNLSHPKATYS